MAMSDEERYGKVGAMIRRLDPEAYKNRSDKSAEANLKLLKELRAKARETPSRKMSGAEFVEEYKKSDTPAGRTTKTETKVTMEPRRAGQGLSQLRSMMSDDDKEESRTTRTSGRGKTLPENYRPKVGSGRFDDPTSSYGERVTSPFRKFGDLFGLRAEERVMKDMGVSREEARKRLEAKKSSSGMRSGGSVKKMRSGGMPDLTGDGKITRADVLKGRGVFKNGGSVKKMAGGGMASSASKRADGIAKKGKTRCKMV